MDFANKLITLELIEEGSDPLFTQGSDPILLFLF